MEHETLTDQKIARIALHLYQGCRLARARPSEARSSFQLARLLAQHLPSPMCDRGSELALAGLALLEGSNHE